MTRKRDLKKRIRDRQAKTGESYTTSRRHVLAGRNTDGDEGEGPTPPDSSDIATVDDAKASRPLITKPDRDHDDVEENGVGPRPDRNSPDPTRPGATDIAMLDDTELTQPGATDIAILDDEDATAPGIANPATIETARPAKRSDRADQPAATGDRFSDELAAARAGKSPRRDVPVDELRKLADLREPIQVDEVIDVSDAAGPLGFGCKVLVYPRLAKVADPARAMLAVRSALDAMQSDPGTAVLRAVVAGKAQTLRIVTKPPVLRDPEFMAKIAAGVTAVSKDGRMMAFNVDGYAGMVTVVCAAWRSSNTLIMTVPEDRIGPVLAGLGLHSESLFLVYDGRRYPISREPFVIGRHPSCNLQIRDGHVSRKHAAIVQRHGAFYIIDLGSHAGIEYKGLKISNKRIEEGDMFKLHEYALRFTFHETDA